MYTFFNYIIKFANGRPSEPLGFLVGSHCQNKLNLNKWSVVSTLFIISDSDLSRTWVAESRVHWKAEQ